MSRIFMFRGGDKSMVSMLQAKNNEDGDHRERT